MATDFGSCQNKIQTFGNLRLNIEDCICPVCLSILIEPVVMPCKHELCRKCFKQNVEETSLCCPMCRTRISTWTRIAAKNNNLVDQKRWQEIRDCFPERVQRQLDGVEEDEIPEAIPHAPRQIAEPGELRREYEGEMNKLRAERTADEQREQEASEALIRKLQDDERNNLLSRLNMLSDIEHQDEQLAKELDQVINENIADAPFNDLLEETQRRLTRSTSADSESSKTPLTTLDAFLNRLRQAETKAPEGASNVPPTEGTYPFSCLTPSDKDSKSVSSGRSSSRISISSGSPSPSEKIKSPATETIGDVFPGGNLVDIRLPEERAGITKVPKKPGTSKPAATVSRVDSAVSPAGESNDSIGQELAHFKPIQSCPRTPPRKLPSGKVLDPPIIRTTPRNLSAGFNSPIEGSLPLFNAGSPIVQRRIEALQQERQSHVEAMSKSTSTVTDAEHPKSSKYNCDMADDSDMPTLINFIPLEANLDCDEIDGLIMPNLARISKLEVIKPNMDRTKMTNEGKITNTDAPGLKTDTKDSSVSAGLPHKREKTKSRRGSKLSRTKVTSPQPQITEFFSSQSSQQDENITSPKESDNSKGDNCASRCSTCENNQQSPCSKHSSGNGNERPGQVDQIPSFFNFLLNMRDVSGRTGSGDLEQSGSRSAARVLDSRGSETRSDGKLSACSNGRMSRPLSREQSGRCSNITHVSESLDEMDEPQPDEMLDLTEHFEHSYASQEIKMTSQKSDKRLLHDQNRTPTPTEVKKKQTKTTPKVTKTSRKINKQDIRLSPRKKKRISDPDFVFDFPKHYSEPDDDDSDTSDDSWTNHKSKPQRSAKTKTPVKTRGRVKPQTPLQKRTKRILYSTNSSDDDFEDESYNCKENVNKKSKSKPLDEKMLILPRKSSDFIKSFLCEQEAGDNTIHADSASSVICDDQVPIKQYTPHKKRRVTKSESANDDQPLRKQTKQNTAKRKTCFEFKPDPSDDALSHRSESSTPASLLDQEEADRLYALKIHKQLMAGIDVDRSRGAKDEYALRRTQKSRNSQLL